MDFLTTPRVARELTWERPLALGATGPDVRRLQEWLALRGFGTGIDGEYGPATGRCVADFTLAERLPLNAVASLEMLAALVAPMRRAFSFECDSRNLREAVVGVARQHAAQHPREMGGDNRGPWVRAYCGRDGSDYAWCAGSALSIVFQACAIRDQAPPFAFTLGCDELAELARGATRFTHDPRTVRGGDLFLCYRGRANGSRDYFHTGIVTAMHADHVETIEGNTNDDGSANGYELVPRTRGLAGKDWVLM